MSGLPGPDGEAVSGRGRQARFVYCQKGSPPVTPLDHRPLQASPRGPAGAGPQGVGVAGGSVIGERGSPPPSLPLRAFIAGWWSVCVCGLNTCSAAEGGSDRAPRQASLSLSSLPSLPPRCAMAMPPEPHPSPTTHRRSSPTSRTIVQRTVLHPWDTRSLIRPHRAALLCVARRVHLQTLTKVWAKVKART